ncbi:MAG TPA: hypothetical protein PLQ34_09475 [Ferrovaceae bacterium]|jgi:hypothetical protein|nr:hypothetical protein [Ferrovaceae bacterium]
MARKEDGVAKKGKTKATGAVPSGSEVGIQNGGKKSTGVEQDKMKAVGRNMAKLAFEKGGA